MGEELFRYEKTPYMTIRELAADVNVSTSTVLRFCNKINCDSYNVFKERFQKYLTECKEVVPGFDLKQLLHYFQGTTTSAFEEKIQEGVKLIQDAEMIVFVGLGSSGALARYCVSQMIPIQRLPKYRIGIFLIVWNSRRFMEDLTQRRRCLFFF